jgi:hypothetical protein
LFLGRISAADTGTTKNLFEIPAGWYVESVLLLVLTAFAGGTPSIDIGDEDAADTWLASTDITETTPGPYKGAAAPAAGKHYSAKQNVTATVSADLTDGSAIVLARAVNVGGL